MRRSDVWVEASWELVEALRAMPLETMALLGDSERELPGSKADADLAADQRPPMIQNRHLNITWSSTLQANEYERIKGKVIVDCPYGSASHRDASTA